jgi:hypothetical protein
MVAVRTVAACPHDLASESNNDPGRIEMSVRPISHSMTTTAPGIEGCYGTAVVLAQISL